MQKNIHSLIGTRIRMEVSEPWDFANQAENDIMQALIESIKDEIILLKLDHPITFKEKICKMLLASTRYQGENIIDILSNKVLTVSMTAIPDDSLGNADPFSFSSWNTGMALIGTIQKV